MWTAVADATQQARAAAKEAKTEQLKLSMRNDHLNELYQELKKTMDAHETEKAWPDNR